MMYRYYAKIFRHYPMLSKKTGFSVAFGRTECSGSAGGRAPFVLLCWVPEAQTPRGVREIYKIGLSKMQIPVFPGPELGNQEGLLRS